MPFEKRHYLSLLVPNVLLSPVAALQLSGCGEAPPGIVTQTAGAGGQSARGGADALPIAGSFEASNGGKTSHEHQASNPTGGSTADDDATAGEAGAVVSASGGGQDGAGGEAVIPDTCQFHTDAPVAGTSGVVGAIAGNGAGGAAGAGATVTLQVSPFVGNYLADSTGRTLYTSGNDFPGDCRTPPVSNCVTDCLLSWPIFPAGARVLATGLDDEAFGAIQRGDGNWQMTYHGWPLYNYKTDLLLGQVAGQGKGKTWHIAQQNPPGIVIMKPGTLRYLADASGHTLYVSAADQAGTADTDPVSNCSETCLTNFEPFFDRRLSVVTSLLIEDFSSFARSGNSGLQIAYQGRPLYRAATDLEPGDMTGTAISGFKVAEP